MKRISLFVLFICTIFSCLCKENERIKQNYIRSIIGMDEEKQPYLQLLWHYAWFAPALVQLLIPNLL